MRFRCPMAIAASIVVVALVVPFAWHLARTPIRRTRSSPRISWRPCRSPIPPDRRPLRLSEPLRLSAAATSHERRPPPPVTTTPGNTVAQDGERKLAAKETKAPPPGSPKSRAGVAGHPSRLRQILVLRIAESLPADRRSLLVPEWPGIRPRARPLCGGRREPGQERGERAGLDLLHRCRQRLLCVRAQALNSAQLPPKEAVRVEEMINYFPYPYPLPETEHTFPADGHGAPSPWNATNKLVHIAIKGFDLPKPSVRAPTWCCSSTPRLDGARDRLPLLRNAFRMLIDTLRPDDTVGIVTYAGQRTRRWSLRSWPTSARSSRRSSVCTPAARRQAAPASRKPIGWQRPPWTRPQSTA